MKQYLGLLRRIQAEGQFYPDRTGTGCTGIFGAQMRFDLADGFPLLTTKKVHLKSVIHELLWFLRGESSIAYLKQNGVSIWDEWADENGNTGRSYGVQWRRWRAPRSGLDKDWKQAWRIDEIDQIANTIQGLKNDPYGRRHIINAWNPADVKDVALPWCHCFWQFRCSPDGRLHLQMYQRSCDVFLGVPFNIASGALLLMLIAQIVGREPGEFIWTGGDVHIYKNHEEQVALQLAREPRSLPKMYLDKAITDIDSFKVEHFSIEEYDPWPTIAAPVSI